MERYQSRPTRWFRTKDWVFINAFAILFADLVDQWQESRAHSAARQFV